MPILRHSAFFKILKHLIISELLYVLQQCTEEETGEVEEVSVSRHISLQFIADCIRFARTQKWADVFLIFYLVLSRSKMNTSGFF